MSYDDDLYPLEECVFSLPRGTVVQGWKMVHLANPVSNRQLEELVPELKWLVNDTGHLLPTNNALILNKCLRVDKSNAKYSYLPLYQPVIALEVMDTCYIAEGKCLCPRAVIEGHGIVIDGNVALVGDSPGAYQATTTGSNMVVIPVDIISALYGAKLTRPIEYTGSYGNVAIRKLGW